MNRRLTLAALVATGLLSTPSFAKTISINNMDIHDLKSRYFQLDKDQQVEVEYLAPKHYQDNEENHDFVWIIDLDSRETVWRSRHAEVIEQANNDKLTVFGEKVSLDKGRYGIYYSTFNFRMESVSGVDFFLYGLSSLLMDKNRITHNDLDDFYVDLRAVAISEINDDQSFNPFNGQTQIANITKVRKSRSKTLGIDVEKDSEISIYAIGEILNGEQADYAWLKDTSNGKTVWQMNYRTTRHAGGSSKNRYFKDSVSLTKGSYVLQYSTDGSHHYNDWNSQPPFDPNAWGISVFAKPDAKITTFDPTQRKNKRRIIAIDQVGDNAFVSKHFSVSKATPMRVIAIGESYSRSSMADHGWIVDAKTQETIWKMRARDTKHAGGARKNRIIDEVITLPAGEYTMQYMTDGSHSYDDGWNSSRPHDEEAWGISLYSINDQFDSKTFKQLDKPNTSVLAQITGVRDSERRSKTFELTQAQDVRIYALGEGDSDELADYGYIKNAETGKRVWNMWADETEHAGGAGKNRMVNEVIHLKAGKYKVYYRTDGSHSFGDWNAKPPRDERNYGITVFDVSK